MHPVARCISRILWEVRKRNKPALSIIFDILFPSPGFHSFQILSPFPRISEHPSSSLSLQHDVLKVGFSMFFTWMNWAVYSSSSFRDKYGEGREYSMNCIYKYHWLFSRRGEWRAMYGATNIETWLCIDTYIFDDFLWYGSLPSP